MTTVTVTALQGFDHGGKYKRHDSFTVSLRVAERLKARGLVRIEDHPEAASADPSPAAGAPSSASPAAPVYAQTTSSVSATGAKPKRTRKKAAASS